MRINAEACAEAAASLVLGRLILVVRASCRLPVRRPAEIVSEYAHRDEWPAIEWRYCALMRHPGKSVFYGATSQTEVATVALRPKSPSPDLRLLSTACGGRSRRVSKN